MSIDHIIDAGVESASVRLFSHKELITLETLEEAISFFTNLALKRVEPILKILKDKSKVLK